MDEQNNINCSVKVLLVDDHSLIRTAVIHTLKKYDHIHVREAVSAEEACSVYSNYRPDIVLMDLVMPGMGGIEGIKYIKAKDPRAKIIVLSARENQIDIQRAIDVGAQGYLTKNIASLELYDSISSVLEGNSYFCREISADYASTPSDKTVLDKLTRREYQILTLLANGHSVTYISENLHLSKKTVSNYKTQIMHKLNITNMVDLAKVSIHHGVIDTH